MHSLRQRCFIKKLHHHHQQEVQKYPLLARLCRKNKIVPITIEINDNDVRMIGESIMESEQKKFDELVAKH